MNKSESIKELAIALAKTHAELSNPKKTTDNPFFKSKYSDLAEVINVSKTVLANNGLSVVQMPSMNGEMVSVETILLHESGEYLSSTMSMVPVKSDPQGLGSCITYIRRYSLAAVLSIAQEDDDANYASQKPAQNKQPKPDIKIINKISKCKTLDEVEAVWISIGRSQMYKSKVAERCVELK